MLHRIAEKLRAGGIEAYDQLSLATDRRRMIGTLLLGRKAEASISDIGVGREKWIGSILIVSCVLLLLGLILPVVRVTKYFIFTGQHSIADGIILLWSDGEYLLALIVLLFSAVFPYYKLDQAYRLWRRTSVNDPGFDMRLHRIEWLSKWSMVDVLVIALIVFSVKMTNVADARSEFGLYFFIAAIAGTAMALGWIKKAANRLRGAITVEEAVS